MRFTISTLRYLIAFYALPLAPVAGQETLSVLSWNIRHFGACKDSAEMQYEGKRQLMLNYHAPHPFLGECASAEVVLHPGAEVDAETLITYCRQRLSTYKVPQRLAFVEALPMTDSGKLKRV